MSADDSAAADTNKQLTDTVAFSSKQDWLRPRLHCGETRKKNIYISDLNKIQLDFLEFT